MKASYRWLVSLVPGLAASPQELARRFTAAGLEVEGVHTYGAACASAIVVAVVSTRPHPTKSGLNLVTVDRGEGTSPLELVCGAPNVPDRGGLVVLAPLGAHLPAKGVTIERRTIAGVVSEGMLCSESELGLTDEGGGILILPHGSARPGQLLSEALPETHDTVFEIGLTPNRPDGLGHIGLAREAAALYALPWSMPRPAVPARIGGEGSATVGDLASVRIDDYERCPRYAAAAVTDVTVAPSPSWLRYRLASLGVRPISNVVDVTNLLLLEYGHPMHAFDLDRLRGDGGAEVAGDGPRSIVVRRAQEGEALTTLDEATHTLTADDLVIADGGGAIALAGVMGGASTEITGSTKHVLLECAHFEARGVRRASRRHALHTDSSHRFERGIDPADAKDVLARASALLVELTGGTAAAGDLEVATGPIALPVTSLRAKRLEQVLGVHVPWHEAKEVLSRLGFGLQADIDGVATVTIPTHRPDVTREIDLVEEVTRVRGMDAIPAVLPRIRPGREDAPRETRARKARAACVELGLSEAITYSFVSRGALESVGAPAPGVILKNPLSLEQEVMRTSLLPGLLEALSRARRHGERDVRLFTVGSIFLGGAGAREHGLPEERQEVAMILAGERAPYLGKPESVDVWDGKGLAEGFVQRMTRETSVDVARYSPQDLPPHLHPRGAARILVNGAPVGRLGPLHPDVVERTGLGTGAIVLELDLASLDAQAKATPRYSAIPRFPASTRDLALVVHDDVTAGEVLRAVRDAAGALATEVTLFDLFQGGAIPPGHRSLAIHVVYRASDRTLTDAEVDAQHAKAVATVGEKFGATLRGA
jgi:phenylalanyl-tRNA synthetase beta chain